VYGHMSKVAAKPNQKVNRGDIIGYVGSTGLSTSPHCHYEVRINDRPVDPVNFYPLDMSEEAYQNLLEASQDLAFDSND
ncbi:MAG: M23 family metallopeptidase, partial [Bacteroidales bacterium]|nr:M23 family metallopeptidase [Bacteroidales bacterium]